jgi:hypothetical protein
VLDDAVFSCRVHGLKYQKQRPAVLGIELVLQFGRARNALLQGLGGMLLWSASAP